MRVRPGLVLLLAAGLLLGACGDTSTPGATPSSDETADVATSDALVGVLRDLLAAIEAGDADKAVSYLKFRSGTSAEEAWKDVGEFVKSKEISAAGIDRLAAEGRFGLLADVFVDRGRAWAKRVGVDITTCYALALRPAAVAAFWNGKTFKVFRLNNVGLL